MLGSATTKEILISFAGTLLYVGGALAASDQGLRPVDIDRSSETFQITNVPKTLDQGHSGICYAMAASTLIDAQTCIDKKFSECKNLSDSLSVARSENRP